MSLYSITKDIREVIINGFTYDEETGEVIFERKDLDQLEMDFEEKAKNVALYIKNLQADELALKREEEIFKARRKAKANEIERLEKYLADSMLAVGCTKLEKTEVALSFRKSETVEIDDIRLVPEDFVKVKTELSADKMAIKKAIKSGTEIKGARLETKMNIQIK